ncbi:hypothetical protein LG293_16210 (plasmid) [Citricoccus nitrophenolicus]
MGAKLGDRPMIGQVRTLWRSQRGEMDLPSTVISVMVVMFFIVGSVLSVQTMVPWQQDRNARAAVEAIAPAQQASLNAAGSYETLDGLVAKKWLEAKPTGVAMARAADGACWSAVTVSKSGTVYLDEGQGPVSLGGAAHTSSCLDTPTIRSLVAQAGGPANWSKISGMLAPPANVKYNQSTRAVTWNAVPSAGGYQVEVRCGSSLGTAPLHRVFTNASTRTTTVPASGCAAGMPMLVSVWTANANGGTPTGRVAGLAVNR